MASNKEIIEQLDLEIEFLEKKIAELKLQNEKSKLTIQKKEIMKIKQELSQNN